jgi:hypothetical protein
MSSEKEDLPAIRREVNSQKLACQICKEPLRSGVDVNVHLQPGTPERLRKIGYPLPPNT